MEEIVCRITENAGKNRSESDIETLVVLGMKTHYEIIFWNQSIGKDKFHKQAMNC